MEVGSTTNTTNSALTDGLYSNENSQLGKDEFLNLLCAQLSHQDPLDPMDNTEFIAQMAQFSALEQQTNLNNNFEQFLSGNSISQYSSLVGKEVTALSESGEDSLQGIVNSISFEDGKTYVSVDGEQVPVENVIKINLANSN